jgi:predicted transcriptional regulator
MPGFDVTALPVSVFLTRSEVRSKVVVALLDAEVMSSHELADAADVSVSAARRQAKKLRQYEPPLLLVAEATGSHGGQSYRLSEYGREQALAEKHRNSRYDTTDDNGGETDD